MRNPVFAIIKNKMGVYFVTPSRENHKISKIITDIVKQGKRMTIIPEQWDFWESKIYDSTVFDRDETAKNAYKHDDFVY
jgi:hypothetical protein